MRDLKTIREYNFKVKYFEEINETALFICSTHCFTMKGEHDLETLAIDYMGSHEFNDALELYCTYQDDPRMGYLSLEECVERIRKLPVDGYGMAILPWDK